jgi:hypothetical protein
MEGFKARHDEPTPSFRGSWLDGLTAYNGGWIGSRSSKGGALGRARTAATLQAGGVN